MTKRQSQIWGGRFLSGPDQIMNMINQSIDFDQIFYVEDIQASKAHAKMLAKQKIISTQDCIEIIKGLDKILQEIEAGNFTFKVELEDIHMNIEARLGELIGPVAGKLHTARSRNDQVATDLRLWLRNQLDRQLDKTRKLQSALLTQAEANIHTIMPGYTHMQVAQPISFAHHLMAYVEMFGRDRERLKDARKRINQLPLGSAALAGTSFPIDREFVAKELGFDTIMPNSMDAVGSRDFIAEYLAVASIYAVHLSRLAEEIVFWMNDCFGFITLPDELTTGSSIMPQKRNPDAAELVRAKPGRIIGALQGILLVLKGLPMTYGKDLQEDKEGLFDAVRSLDMMLIAMTAMIERMMANPETMLKALEKGYPTATDLADWLVKELGLPFREAHHITGTLVMMAEEKGVDLGTLSLDEMQKIEPKINSQIYDALQVRTALASRNSYGGTAPETVKQAIEKAKGVYL